MKFHEKLYSFHTDTSITIFNYKKFFRVPVPVNKCKMLFPVIKLINFYFSVFTEILILKKKLNGFRKECN